MNFFYSDSFHENGAFRDRRQFAFTPQNDFGGGDGKPSLYPVLRLLLPYLDRDRGAYGIKESVLADLYIDFLQLGKKSYDAQKLKNFRTPKNNSASQGGNSIDILGLGKFLDDLWTILMLAVLLLKQASFSI